MTSPVSPTNSSPPKSSSETKSDWQQAVELSRQRQTRAPRLTDDGFKEQAAYLLDESSRTAVLCTRRAGKSYGAALRLLRAAYARPGSSCLYIALTRESAKRILWKDILKAINRTERLGAEFNETQLSMTLPNGSIIYLLGADTNEDEKQKLLGQKYACVVIDESASFTIDLRELVEGIIEPALADLKGTVSLIGTPGNLKKGLFFDLTQNQDPLTPGRWNKNGWSCHRWSAKDNPHIAKEWADKIAELKANNPLVEETATFRQHYLGQWVIEEDKLVYKYRAGRNDFETIDTSKDGWSFVLGVDLGYSPDPSAFTLGAFHEHDRTLYVLESWKKLEMDITDVANTIKAYQAKFDISKVIIDGSAKQAVMEMQKRHGIQLTPTEKVGKVDHIGLMNDDFVQGYIKLSPQCQPLKDEYAELIWDDKGDTRREHPGCDNHATDASLYMWRWAYSYLATRKPEKQPDPGSQEWHQAHAKRMEEEHQKMYDSAMEDALERKREKDEMEEYA